MATLVEEQSQHAYDDGAVPPLRQRALNGRSLVTDRAGRFMLGAPGLGERLRDNRPSAADKVRLEAQGLWPSTQLEQLAARFAAQLRQCAAGPLDYLILVPTLRCNLSCSYCQVSRAALDASGHDWSPDTLAQVLTLVRGLEAPMVKIEFQGGEPTLRPDLIRAVMNAVPDGVEASFVICTNLQQLDADLLALFDRPDVQISTSLDGAADVHARQRHGERDAITPFLANLDLVLRRYGPGKVSALPTVDPVAPPAIETLVEAFVSRGFTSIYLRPINYQGFARKRHPRAIEVGAAWRDYHAAFIRHLIERNWVDRSQLIEESYFSLLLRRIFRPGEDRHVDLRSPNPIGRDYIVIDHDGLAYPSDEARMLTRAGVINLAIGTAANWDTAARAALEAAATNAGDPDCERCVYQPFCGRDIFDDLSRYGTISLPRRETEFCRRHLDLFDRAFELIHDTDPAVQYSLRRWLGLPGDDLTLGNLA